VLLFTTHISLNILSLSLRAIPRTRSHASRGFTPPPRPCSDNNNYSNNLPVPNPGGAKERKKHLQLSFQYVSTRSNHACKNKDTCIGTCSLYNIRAHDKARYFATCNKGYITFICDTKSVFYCPYLYFTRARYDQYIAEYIIILVKCWGLTVS
jgi:hypothetical protein